ncbi:MAG: hypothetical protein UZ17_ACD001001564 [Acidobacteria bacterium OLB17]|nr:MAG: hypothetical protein UZ17_ACD001001564 [Acidobacteria bacterium OLB17]MCZ2391367.1 hypothetical protein [Acidobacteriota bacterium]
MTSSERTTLGLLPVGSRIVVRSRTDWRHAAIARIADDKVVLTVHSPTGYAYRLRRTLDAAVAYDGAVAVLTGEYPDDWRENFSPCDTRW